MLIGSSHAGAHPLLQVAVDAHTGYDLGLLDKICPVWGGTLHHDNHHRNPRSNFQPFFTWFDWYFETDFASVEAAKAKRRASAAKTE